MVKLSSNPTCVLSDADVITNEQAERIAKVLTKHLPGANNVTEAGKILGVNAEGDVSLVEDKTGSTYTAGTGLTLENGEFSVDNPMPGASGASQGDVLTIGSSGPEWATPSAGGGFSPTLYATANRSTNGVFSNMPEAGLRGWYVLECMWYRNGGSGTAEIKVYWEDSSMGPLEERPLCCATSSTLANPSTDEVNLVYALFYVKYTVSGVPIKIKLVGDSGLIVPEINVANIYAL